MPLHALLRRPPSGGLRRYGPSGLRPHGQCGFTLVELVIVMTLMAIITAVGMARFGDREPFAVQGLADQLISSLRIAQASAVARRQNVYVTLTATPAAMTVCLDAACSQPLPAPGGDGAWLLEAQGLTLSAATSFSFDGAGAPSFTTPLSLNVRSADGSVVSPAIRIEAVSGHVH